MRVAPTTIPGTALLFAFAFAFAFTVCESGKGK
jgi:hypothetical protein